MCRGGGGQSYLDIKKMYTIFGLVVVKMELGMTPETWFAASGPLVLTGWAALIAAPWIPRLAQVVAGLVIPALLSVAYAVLIALFWTSAEGGYGSLAEVMALFRTPEIALAGWLHYLAFDLFVGAWEVRTARDEGIPHLLVLPCLALTFLFGPVGFALFLALRAARRARPLPEA
jgi:hypothetical protein